MENSQSHRAKGLQAEQLVADWLRSRGHQIVAQNLRLGPLELDIVARKDELIIVVEVRTRSPGSFSTGLSSIDQKKRKRFRRAGERLWDRRYRADPSAERMRFDVATVSFEFDPPRLEYIPAAL